MQRPSSPAPPGRTVHTGRRRHRPWWSQPALTLLLILALVATSCTFSAEDVAVDAEGEKPSETADELAVGPLAALQDLWILARMQAVSADGTTTDVLDAVVAELDPLADAAMPLVEELAFRPVAALAPRMVTATGAPRDSVEVVAGLLEVTEAGRATYDVDTGLPASTLAVIASAGPDDVHVTTGDLLGLDIFDLEALAGVDTVLVDHVFGQSRAPGTGQVETPTADPVALLAERWQDGRVIIGAPDGAPDDGPDDAADDRPETAAALFVGVPLQRVDTLVATPVSWQPEAEATVVRPAALRPDVSASAVPAATPDTAATPGHELRTVVSGEGGSSGFLPAKAQKQLLMVALFEVACIAFGAVISYGAGVVVAAAMCTAISAIGVGYTVMDLLDENTPGDEPEAECEWPCARSSGDPHLSTFQGDAFTIQAAGEFIAARAPDVLELQVRRRPLNASAAVNSAVALTLGGSRVSIDTDAEVLVRVDGEPALTGEFDLLDLGDGASLQRHGAVILARWPDGSSLWVRARLGSIDYALDLTETAATEVTGLHGTGDGRLVTADGRAAEVDVPHDELLRTADTWRITDAQSLFDRAPGTSTATWTDLDFPAAPVTLASLDPTARERASVICRAAGLIDVHLDNCILDVASSGDASFATSARELQRLVDPDAPPPALDGFYDTAPAVSDDSADGEVDVAALAWLRDDVRPLGARGGTAGLELVVTAGIVLSVSPAAALTAPADLVALDASDGSTRWELAELAVCDPVVTSDGLVVALLANGDLVSVDPATGAQLHRLPDQGPTGQGCGSGLRAADDGVVLRPMLGFGTARNASALRAYDTRQELTLRWERQFDEDQLATALGVHGEVYVIGDRAGTAQLQQLDATTGATRAALDLDLNLASGIGALAEGVLVALPDRSVGVLGTDAGNSSVARFIAVRDSGSALSVAWDVVPGAELGSDRGFERVRVLENRSLLVGWVGDGLVALDLADGALRWATRVSSFQNNSGAITVDGDGQIVVATFGGALLEALDADGAPRWQVEEISGIDGISQVGPIVDGRLFLTASFARDSGLEGSGVVAIDVTGR